MASKDQRQWAARAKVASNACATYAIAFMGAAILKPLTENAPMQLGNYGLIIAALVLHFWSLYLAGKGEL